MNWPLLSALVFTPFLAVAVIWLLPARHARQVAVAGLLVTLALAMATLLAFDPLGPRYQWLERHDWLPLLGGRYQLAIDGLSVLFLPACVLLFLAALVSEWRRLATQARLACSMWLLFAGCTLGIFCAVDGVLFFVFWEGSLLPVYFLIADGQVATASARIGAANRYFLLMLASGALLLLGLVVAAVARPEFGFDLIAQSASPLPLNSQWLIFALCLLGLAAKIPLVPLHTWLPTLTLVSGGGLLALLLGLKVGAYALIRIAIPLAPDVALQLHWLLAGWGTLTLLYGAVGLLGQTNLRSCVAYAGICHVGLVVLGLASFNAQSVQGAVALLQSFSVSTGGALLLLEALRQRTGTTDVAALGGAARQMPLLAAGVLICGLAGVGLPGTSSFPGEFLLLMAILERHPGAGMAALFGLAIAAGGFLSLYRQAFWGPVRREHWHGVTDLLAREWAVLVVLVGLVVVIGLWPQPWLDLVAPAAQAWAAALQR